VLAGVWKDLAVVCDTGFEDIGDEIGVISTLGELVSDSRPTFSSIKSLTQHHPSTAV